MESERRREERFPIKTGATVTVNKDGRTVSATTVDISGCGVLLQFEEPVILAVGDHVVCDFAVSHETDKPLPYWGVGCVVRVDGCYAAVDFQAGGLSPLNPESGGQTRCD
jgi:hypothetical protein